MALVTKVVWTDDITGQDMEEGSGETLTFAYDGTRYEIDLDRQGAAKFRATMAYYAGHGRPVSPTSDPSASMAAQPPAMSRLSRTHHYDNATVRRWAQANNIDVPVRGRIPRAVIDLFTEAGN